MFNQQYGHIEVFSYKLNGVHQFLCFVRVHAGSRFVQQKQLRRCRKRSCNLEFSLFAVRQIRRNIVLFIRQSENFQKFLRLFIHRLFGFVVGWKTEDSAYR